MNPRHGLIVGSVVAAMVAVVLAIVPATWLADMLDVTGDDAATFLVRRYAVSATAALAVAAIAILRDTRPHKAVLLGYGTWFTVQAVTVWWGVLSGSVGGLAWAAVVADPLIAAWFLVLSRTRALLESSTERKRSIDASVVWAKDET